MTAVMSLLQLGLPAASLAASGSQLHACPLDRGNFLCALGAWPRGETAYFGIKLLAVTLATQ